MYSHLPSDIKAYLELKNHKEVLVGAFKKTGEKCKASANTNSNSQTSAGANGTSPGVKPKYKSILRGPGTVTRKTFLRGCANIYSLAHQKLVFDQGGNRYSDSFDLDELN